MFVFYVFYIHFNQINSLGGLMEHTANSSDHFGAISELTGFCNAHVRGTVYPFEFGMKSFVIAAYNFVLSYLRNSRKNMFH